MKKGFQTLMKNLTRSRVYALLHPLHSGSHTGRIVEIGLMILIVANIFALILESVPALNARYGRLFVMIEIV